MVQTASYNERGQMSSIGLHKTPASGTSRLLTLGMGYGTAVENNGNVRTITVAAGQAASGTVPLFSAVQVYEYDAVNRLKTATEGTAWKQPFGYDRFGNRWIEPAPADTFGIVSPGAPTNAGAFVGGSNRLSGVPHDWAGNASAGGQKMTYDVENRLVMGRDITLRWSKARPKRTRAPGSPLPPCPQPSRHSHRQQNQPPKRH